MLKLDTSQIILSAETCHLGSHRGVAGTRGRVFPSEGQGRGCLGSYLQISSSRLAAFKAVRYNQPWLEYYSNSCRVPSDLDQLTRCPQTPPAPVFQISQINRRHLRADHNIEKQSIGGELDFTRFLLEQNIDHRATTCCRVTS